MERPRNTPRTDPPEQPCPPLSDLILGFRDVVAAGVPPVRVITWQAAAIALWTTAVTLIITGVIRFAA